MVRSFDCHLPGNGGCGRAAPAPELVATAVGVVAELRKVEMQATMAKSQVLEVPLEKIVFREDLYPRIEKSPVTVQKYAEDLDVLPPIEINQRHELIDGWHRWTAHRKRAAATIRATITPTASDMELLELAIERNSKHGLQLSQEDKRDMACRIYAATPMEQQGPKKQRIADILSVTLRTVQHWLSRIDKDNQEKREAAVFNLWLACHTEEQIAAALGMSQPNVVRLLSGNESFRFLIKPGECVYDEKGDERDEKERFDLIEAQNRAEAGHKTDFAPPLYNVWKQQEKTPGSTHFGNSEVRWLDNLLYLYTQPFDIVVDPFAGGGSTIDICRKRFRRYWVSDRKPVVERESEIRSHDIAAGLPRLRWQDVKLIYLDPPYWKQAEDAYSNDPEDLANMPLDQFHLTMAKIIHGFSKKLRPGAAIAMLMQPTQWAAPEHRYTDHILEICCRLPNLPVDLRISAPYESQQCTAQMVKWAQKNRRLLVLTREIVVWRVA